MERRIRKFAFILVAFMMTAVMAAFAPMQVFAASSKAPRTDGRTTGKNSSGNTYVKDVIIVTKEEASNMQKPYNDYIVLNAPFSEAGGKSLYFAVSTTTDPNEAITDIKAMNMNGDYDYKAYEEYLKEVNTWAQAKADTTMKAIEEFKTNYEAEKPGALFAYDMMDYLVGDNEDISLGEAFVNDDYATSLEIQVKNLVMKSNLTTLAYVRQLLLVACSDTLETNFVEQLLTHGKNNPLIDDGSRLYNTAAQDLIYSMGDTSRMINAYRDALKEHGDGLNDYLEKRSTAIDDVLSENDMLSDEYDKALEERETIEDITSGMVLCDLFDDVYYLNNKGVMMSLTDILAKDPEAEKEEDRPTIDMVIPIVALMSEGQRGLAGCGFDKLVGSVINDYSGEDSGYAESYEEIQDMWGDLSAEDLVSIYAGVDLSLFDPNGIAMVGKSGEFLKNGDNDNDFLGISTLAASFMLGGSVVGIAGSCVLMKMGMRASTSPRISVLQNNIANLERRIRTNMRNLVEDTVLDSYERLSPERIELMRIYNGANKGAKAGISNAQKEIASLKSTGMYLKAFSTFMFVLSVALLVFSIVTIIMNETQTEAPPDYSQIPRVLVNGIEKAEFDERQQKVTTTQMIFYQGIIDPFMNSDDANEKQTPSKVMDVFNWSQTDSNREWIALYTTKDGRAGHPIIYNGKDKTLVSLVGDSSKYAELEAKQKFNGRVNIFNKDTYVKCGSGILVFDSDLKVESEARTGLGSTTGSMTIDNGKFILFIMLAAMAGGGIGVGACLIINKSKKKKEVSNKTV